MTLATPMASSTLDIASNVLYHKETAYLPTSGGVQWLGNKEKVVAPLASAAEAALGTCVMGHLV